MRIPPASLFASLLLFASAQVFSAPPVTQSCDKAYSYGEVIVYFRNPTIAQDFMALVANPARDPALFHRIWEPKAARLAGIDWGVFSYESAQDAMEIAQALVADSTLRPASIDSTYPNGRSGSDCCGVLLAMKRVTLTEWHNKLLDHYFLSSSEEENRAIDSGAAGPGWERTGESFQSSIPDSGYGARRVFRFYNPAAKSHFFTVDPGECGLLRNRDPGWKFEGDAFGATLPANGVCPPRTQPVYRLYNGRWMQNDSNHRFVTRVDLYQSMQAQGWIGEGVSLCAVN